MPHAIAARGPGGPEVLTRVEIDLPEPGPGEVRVRQTAIGVNFIDVYFRSGLYPWPVDRDLILGSEGAGVVEALGEGVTGFAPGQRVAYTVPNGAYATHRHLPAAQLVVLPDSIDDATAAAVMLKGLTVHYLIHHSYKVAAGDTVLFHAAAGGVGLIAGQWLAAKGARAIGTAGGPAKCDLARQNGYAEVIDYRDQDFAPEAMRLTGGAGYEAVYDSVGRDTAVKSLACLKRFGTMVSFGQSSGPPDDVRVSHLARASLRMTRPTLFHHTASRDWLVGASRDLFDMIAADKIRIRIDQTFPLDRAADGHRALESRATTGSTVLIP